MSDEEPPKKVARLLDKQIYNPIALEVCCGHAGLSVQLQKKGWSVRPIDWIGNEHKTKIPVLHKDLTDSRQVEQVLKLIAKAGYVHAAPPAERRAKHGTDGGKQKTGDRHHDH